MKGEYPEQVGKKTYAIGGGRGGGFGTFESTAESALVDAVTGNACAD